MDRQVVMEAIHRLGKVDPLQVEVIHIHWVATVDIHQVAVAVAVAVADTRPEVTVDFHQEAVVGIRAVVMERHH